MELRRNINPLFAVPLVYRLMVCGRLVLVFSLQTWIHECIRDGCRTASTQISWIPCLWYVTRLTRQGERKTWWPWTKSMKSCCAFIEIKLYSMWCPRLKIHFGSKSTQYYRSKRMERPERWCHWLVLLSLHSLMVEVVERSRSTFDNIELSLKARSHGRANLR